jgi:hypothetical protein
MGGMVVYIFSSERPDSQRQAAFPGKTRDSLITNTKNVKVTGAMFISHKEDNQLWCSV